MARVFPSEVYFGMIAVSEIPALVEIIEDPGLPFSSISVMKRHNKQDMTYKIFSRKPMDDALLDSIVSYKERKKLNGLLLKSLNESTCAEYMFDSSSRVYDTFGFSNIPKFSINKLFNNYA